MLFYILWKKFIFFYGTCHSRVTSFTSHYKARAISAYYVHVMLFSGSFVSNNKVCVLLKDRIGVNLEKRYWKDPFNLWMFFKWRYS